MRQFNCPECGHDHVEPIDATFVLAVRCADCDLTIALEARHLAERIRKSRADQIAA